MLRRIILGASLLAGLYLVAGPAFAAEYKVGFVDAEKVLTQAPQAEDAGLRLEKEFEARNRRLVGVQKEIRALETKLVKDGAVMSDGEVSRTEREVRARKRELKRQQDEYRDDLNLRRNEEMQKLQRKVIEAIQTLAKEEKFDLIVGDVVFFASKRVDVTAKVIDRLKREFKKK